MKLAQALSMAVCAAALAANGCSNGTGGGGGTGGASASGGSHSGGQPGSGGSGSGGQIGSGGSGSGGNASGGGGGNASGGTAGDSSGGGGGRASGGAGGSASGGGGGTATGGNGSDSGVASGGSTGTGGRGGNGNGGEAAGGSTGTGGRTGSGGAGGGGGPGTGGTTGTGGSTGTGGGTGGGSICKFASGLNVAWVNFAADVPNPDINTFNKIFKDTHDAGGRIVRWWFHTNGTTTPGYNADGTVKKIQQSHIDGVKAILAAANSAGIAVDISLWSFDMAQDNAGSAAAQNKNLVTQDSIRQSYIDNYLTDLVKGLKGTPGLYSYEIFNEPEGMSTTGWATQWKVDEKYIQMCVNWWAAAIHAADPTVPVTNGSQTMDYCSNASGKKNYYSDSALQAAGGKSTGTLDFYEVHYYQVNGSSDNVFANPASYWGLTDKKLVIGEFAAYSQDTSPVAVNDSFTYLYSNGYDGAWAWSYTEGNSNYKWPSMQTPMKNLYTAQQATIDACP